MSILKGYASMGELLVGLTEYFAFYNGERPHQSLGQTRRRMLCIEVAWVAVL
jgi:hypothetical protein